MRLKPIDQQVVVVMGASSGIGRETAHQLARRGARVVVSARSQSGLDSLVEEIRGMGGEATAVVADVADYEQVRNVAETAVATYGRLDTWVHLAAVTLYATFEQTTPEEFKRVVDVNLLGQVHGAKAALPHLRKEGGALIHVSSLEAIRSLPYQSAYGASKHGIAGFLDALRLELKHEGVPVSVTNIMPASINTPLFSKARTKLGVEPMGLPPIYRPEVVAEAILYAAEHPVRDLFAGDAARVMAQIQALSPRLLDLFLLLTGFRGQRTNRPKGESAPDSLFAPIEGYDQVEGDFGNQALPISPYNKFVQSTTWRKTAIAGLAMGAVLLLIGNALRNGSTDRDTHQKERRMSHKKTLATWLQDAHAMEKALVPVLENHAKDAQGNPPVHARIQQHAEATRRHADLVKGCLERLGESPSSAKSGTGSIFGNLQSVGTGPAQDEQIKNVLQDFAAEHFEIASYKSLISAAEAANEPEVARVCREILQDEEGMASFLESQIAPITQESMQKMGVA